MKGSGLPLSLFFLLLVAAVCLSCGSPSSSNVPHSIQAITIKPGNADAQDYPNGQVQFTATGYYNQAPAVVSPLAATWGVCYQNAPTTDASVTKNGLAACAPGAAGTYTVYADDPPDPSCLVIGPCGGGCFVTGTAQLTCP